MAKKRRRKKSIWRSTFYRVYFSLVFLGIVALVTGSIYLNGLLKDYESAQPVHVARTAARLFENADYETIYSLDTSAAEIADGDREFYVQNMRALSNGKEISWNEAYSGNENEKRYSVLLGGEKFADISLVPSGRQTRHGNTIWRVASVTTHVALEEPSPPPEPVDASVPQAILCRLTAPSDSTVRVDGVDLGESDIVRRDIPTAAANFLPTGVQSPTMIEYAFYSESGAPEIQAVDKYGNAQTVQQSGEFSWTCPLAETPGLREKFEENVIKVAQSIARYSAKDLSKGGVLQYCAKNSPARTAIDNFDTTWGTPHNGAKFENIVTSEFYQYSNECFSCRVSFDYVAHFAKDVDRTYATAYTLYFVRQGNSGKLYSFSLS